MKPAKGNDYPPAGDQSEGGASGIKIDGVEYPLDGQPPVAVSHGWGNLSWWYQNRRYFPFGS